MSLGRAVRVNIVNVGKVCLEPVQLMSVTLSIVDEPRELTLPRLESWYRLHRIVSASMPPGRVAQQSASGLGTVQKTAHPLRRDPGVRSLHVLAVMHAAARAVLVAVPIAAVSVAEAGLGSVVYLQRPAAEALQQIEDSKHVGSQLDRQCTVLAIRAGTAAPAEVVAGVRSGHIAGVVDRWPPRDAGLAAPGRIAIHLEIAGGVAELQDAASDVARARAVTVHVASFSCRFKGRQLHARDAERYIRGVTVPKTRTMAGTQSKQVCSCASMMKP